MMSIIYYMRNRIACSDKAQETENFIQQVLIVIKTY